MDNLQLAINLLGEAVKDTCKAISMMEEMKKQDLGKVQSYGEKSLKDYAIRIKK